MRCIACNTILADDDLKRKSKDRDYCSNCRFQSTRQFSINDIDYTHGTISGVQLDGSSLIIESGYNDTINEEKT